MNNVNYKPILLLVFLLLSMGMSAKNGLVKCGGTYLYHFQKSVSMDQAEHEAVQYAIIEAMAETFGVSVSEQTIAEIHNSDNNFDQISETLVRGRWVKDIHEPKLIFLGYEDNVGTIRATVSFYAREIKKDKSVTLRILRNGTTDNCEDDTFFGCDEDNCRGRRGDGGDDLFMSVVSKKDGYIAVFFEDPHGVTCILPYTQSDNAPYHVRKGERYVFFEKGDGTDTFHFMCGPAQEVNKVYLVFSPNKFIDGDLMREMERKPFINWLGKMQSYDEQMEIVGPVMITVKPTNK